MELLNLDQPLEGYIDFKKGVESLHLGDHETAFSEFEKAREWALANDDIRLNDRATASGLSVIIARGEYEKPIQRLRSILNRVDPENSFLAAYNIARAFECKKEYRKGQFYARLAFQQAEAIQRSEWLGWSHNQLGNFSMALGETTVAMEHYREAIRYIDPSNRGWLALIHQNIGYGHLVKGETQQGFRHLFYGLRIVRRLGLETSLTHLDLSWGMLEAKRPRLALKHAQKALDLAKIEGDKENTKNALLLLGQAARELSQRNLADQCYSHLESFYPGQEHWVSMVKNINVNSLISLRA